MCECKIDIASNTENTTEFEDWVLDGLKKAEEMLKDKVKGAVTE